MTPEPTRSDPGLAESKRAFPADWYRQDYEVKITKPGRVFYCIQIGVGLCDIGPWHTWTLNGARRKARRIVDRDRRRWVRRETVLEGWTVDGHVVVTDLTDTPER